MTAAPVMMQKSSIHLIIQDFTMLVPEDMIMLQELILLV